MKVRLKPQLKDYSNPELNRGRGRITQAIWILVQALLLNSWIPGSAYRVLILRLFGARIGEGVVVKPHVRIKFPWFLEIGNNSWIGENVWIDNLAFVRIGSDCCISQGAYLCTGSHDWSKQSFDLILRQIKIEDGAWIAARGTVAPGVTIGQGAVLGLASVATRDLEPWAIHMGVPAQKVGTRD